MQRRQMLYVVATLAAAAFIAFKSFQEPTNTATSQLSQLEGDRYRSPAGLIYGPGSRHGHRLRHVLAHGGDDPGRSGPHGVFKDGSEEAVVSLIDEAYRAAPTNGESRMEGNREVLTVVMGRSIGYVGGQAGKRDGYPDCQHIRIVLEGMNVITAYPLDVGPRNSDE